MSADLCFTTDSSFILFRPPDIHVGGLIISFHGLFFCLLFSFFVSYCPHSLNGTKPKPVTCWEVSAIWKCMFKMWGITLQIGGPKPTFWTTSQLNGNFNGLCLWKETWYRSGQVRCKLQWVFYIVSKRYEPWSTNGFKLEVSFYPPYKFCIPLNCHALQTEISIRNSTKFCQTVDNKSR